MNYKSFALVLLLLSNLVLGQIFSTEQANTLENESNSTAEADNASKELSYPFTGKVLGNSVRLRLQPATESQIAQTLEKDKLLLITGEKENFYEVMPPSGTKTYVFRTFVIGDTVEGQHVNVRLTPSLEAPVLVQLNTGDKLNGIMTPDNSKWLETNPPASVRFYIAKEYIEAIGDKDHLAQMEKKAKELNHLLNSAYLISQAELKKSFDEVDFEKMTEGFNRVINNYPEFEEKVSKAKEAIAMIQDQYLKKKIAFLESQAVASNWRQKNSELSAKITTYQSELQDLERRLNKAREELNSPNKSADTSTASSEPSSSMANNSELAKQLVEDFQTFQSGLDATERMQQWRNVEESLFHLWAVDNNDKTVDDYLIQEQDTSSELVGVIEPYYSPVKNKPGDHFLRDIKTGATIAYLYSTKIDLQGNVGKKVKIKATQRPNNYFAYPAYHVWSVE